MALETEQEEHSRTTTEAWKLVFHCLEEDDFEKVLSLLDTLPRGNEKRNVPKEEEYRCRVYCLIQTGCYTEALTLCKRVSQTDPALAQSLTFERAYALYKLNHFGKSLSLVYARRCELRKHQATAEYRLLSYNPNDPEDEKLAILEAQLLYRMGSYRDSLSVFAAVRKCDPDQQYQINQEACRSLTTDSNVRLTLDECRSANSYELTYNAGCVALYQQRYREAEDFLDLALEQCLEGKDASLLSSDRKADLLLIRLQRAYLDQKQGRNEEALNVYRTLCPNLTVCSDADLDSTVSMAVTTNVAVLQDQPNRVPVPRGSPRWLLMQMLAATSDHKNDDGTSLPSLITLGLKPNYRSATTLKLTAQQLIPLIKNHCIAMLRDGRSRECARYLSSLPFLSPPLAPLFAVAKIQEKDYATAGRILQKVATLYDDVKVEYRIRAMLAFIKGNEPHKAAQVAFRYLKATDLLTASNLSRRALYYLLQLLRLICPQKCSSLLQEANSFLASTAKQREITRDAAFVFGELMLEELQHEAAFSWFNYSKSLDETAADVYSRIGELRSAAYSNPSKAEAVLAELKQIPGSVFSSSTLAQIDPDDVEQTAVGASKGCLVWASPAGSAYLKVAQDSPFFRNIIQSVRGDTDDQLITSKKVRSRKRVRYPKGFDPQNTSAFPLPDPERWLPKQERTAYKKAKKVNPRLYRGAQGTVQPSASSTVDQGGKKASTANVELKRDTKRRVK